MLTTSEGSIKFKITTRVGRSQLSKLGEGSKYSNRRQFIVRRRDKNWYIEPLPDTTHQTLLNDKAVIKRSEISNGDVISIGDEAKNVSVFPMKVEID